MLQNFDVFKDETNHCFQLRTKTDSYILEFDDPEKEAIFLKIVAIITKESAIVLKKIKAQLIPKYAEPKVIEVLKILDENGLLSFTISASLQYQDVRTNITQNKIEESGANNAILTIVGKGELAQSLFKVAKEQTFKNVNLNSYQTLFDKVEIEATVKRSDFLIVDGNEWSPYHVELINEYALKYTKPWLYVSGIEGVSIKVGPLFYGKETGCYNCLISRIKSNNDYPAFLDSYENYLRGSKKSAKPDILPNSDLMYNALSNLALLEVMKFFQEWSLPVTWKTVLSFDVIGFTMTKHQLLKKPFCEVCKPTLEYNPAPWLELITLK